MTNSISSSHPDASVPAHCHACLARFRVPLAPTAKLYCPQCGSDQIVDHNVEPASADFGAARAAAHLTVVLEATPGQPTGGGWRVERGGSIYSILSDEPNEAGDPKVIAVAGEDVASPLDDAENRANAFLLASSKYLRQSVGDLLEVVRPCGPVTCICRRCTAIRAAQAALALSQPQKTEGVAE